jgi:hypothetical protein
MDSDDAKRAELAALMKNGLRTEVRPRADDQEAIAAVVRRLGALAPDDDAGKLTIAGFTDYPYRHDDLEQSCETCMYYLVHRRFCDLPALMLPVEPGWSCRLWRI